VYKVIWQKAASPFCNPSRRRMHSYAACPEQAHSPAVGTLQWVGVCPP